MDKGKIDYKVASWCMVFMFLIMFICAPVYAIGPKDGDEVELFEEMVDEYVMDVLEKYHIAGVTLAAVKDGKILLKKGYGFADIEKKIKVDPDETLFRIGSVTKLFTATAAMQLVEQRKINLNTEIGKYLKDVKIENKYNTPITMANLLTHTAGFDVTGKGIWSDILLDEVKPLEDTIKSTMPPVIRRPGEIVQYSNYGYTLIGYIVEQVSGTSFDQYVEVNIFKPLGMNKSSYFLSPNILPRLSKGYVYKKDHFEAQQLGQILSHPAGSICATADDMAKFLIAHLQNGELSGNRILQENTALNMQRAHFTHNDFFSGQGYGFVEKNNNRQIIEHNGNTKYFSSKLSLYPEKNIGFFISYNTPDQGDVELSEEFEEKFYEFFQINKKNNIPEASTKLEGDYKKFQGDYMYVRRVRAYYDKIRFVMFKLKVRVNKNGELYLKSPDEHDGVYMQKGENLFKNKSNDKFIYFRKDKDGKEYLILDGAAPLQAFEKLSTQERIIESFIGPFSLVMGLLGCVVWIICLFRSNKNKNVILIVWAKRISSLTCLFILVVAVSLIMFIFTGINLILLIKLLGVLIIICVVGMLVLGVSIWKKQLMSMSYRFFYTLVALAGIGTVIYLNYMKIFTLINIF